MNVNDIIGYGFIFAAVVGGFGFLLLLFKALYGRIKRIDKEKEEEEKAKKRGYY